MASQLSALVSGVKKWIALPLAVAIGGTGQSAFTNGQILIGNAAGGLTKTTISIVANQTTITNGDGAITIGTVQDIGTSSAVQHGSLKIGTSVLPTGATSNVTLGGGATTPVLGAATADIVSIAAVDKAAGDRRAYFQAELGSAISIGNDRINFAASTGYFSVGGNDTFQIQSGLLTLNNASIANDVSGSIFTMNGGADGTLGPLVFSITTHPSATGGNRYSAIGCGDFGAMRLIALNTNGTGSFGKCSIGTVTPSAWLSVLGTTEQMRASYDASNYLSTTVSSVGVATLTATGSAPYMSLQGIVSIGQPNRGMAVDKSFVDPSATAVIMNFSGTPSITANSSVAIWGVNADVRINQNGFTYNGGIRGVMAGIYATGTTGTVTALYGVVTQVGNLAAGTVTDGAGFAVASNLNNGGGTLTTNTGFLCLAQTAGTTIYGFRGQIAASSGRWNVYMDGTAVNHMAGELMLGTTTSGGGSAILTIADAKDIAVGSTTGTKIGTATTQKLSLYGVTPIVQRSGAAQVAVSTTTATQTTPWGFSTQAQADGIVTLLNEVRASLVAFGMIKGAA